MARPLNYEAATTLLEEVFAEAEADFAAGASPSVPDALATATERLMASRTQAFRETLIGCCLAPVA